MKKRILITLMLSMLLVLVCVSGAMAAGCGATNGQYTCTGDHSVEYMPNGDTHIVRTTHNVGTSQSFQTSETSKHTIGWVNMKKCTSESNRGYDVRKCPDCSYVDESNSVVHGAAAERTYIDQDATCGEAGSKHTVCNACDGVTISTEVIPPHGNHKMYVAEERAATCTEVSYKLEKCENCTLEIESVGHYHADHVSVEILSDKETCCYEGYNKLICRNCTITLQEKSSTIAPNGNHPNQERVVTREATCTSEGAYEMRCTSSGKAVSTGKIGLKDHKYVAENVKCGSTYDRGYTHMVCSVCYNEDKATGHYNVHSDIRYEDTQVKATCVSGGLGNSYCDTCEVHLAFQVQTPKNPSNHDTANTIKKYVEEPSCCSQGAYNTLCGYGCGTTIGVNYKEPATGNHKNTYQGNITKQPTCTETGTAQEICPVYTRVVGTIVLPKDPDNHSFTKKVSVACNGMDNRGYDIMACERCGKEDASSKVSHTGEKKIITIEAQCCVNGAYDLDCPTCGKRLSTRLGIEPTNTNHSEKWIATKEATCTTAGEEMLVCTVRGNSLNKTRAINPLGHKIDSNYVSKTLYCTKVSEEVHKCTREGCTYTETWYGKFAPGHDEQSAVTREVTCLVKGVETVYCANRDKGYVCDFKTYTKDIPALGHVSDDECRKVTTLDPNCCVPGEYDLQCTRCSDIVKTLEHPATGGCAEEVKVITAPTCTVKGKNEIVCAEYGTHIRYEDVQELGHTKDGRMDIKYEPTCCDSGWYNLYCNRCNVMTADKLPLAATGNHKADWREMEPATCTTSQVLGLYCGNTNKPLYQYKDGEGPNGHSWGEWVVITPATETTEGVKEHTCTACGVTETAAIDKLTPAGTATPAPTGDPAVTATPAPTGDPAVTATPAPTGDPTVTATPAPTGDPTVTATPAPTGDPTVTATPAPTGDPSVTATPAPTGDPAVTATPAPTGDPAVTATPAPTGDPAVTATPAPTGDPSGDDDCQHVEEELKGFPPTCTEQGREDGTICGECGEVLGGGEWINPTGHKPVVIPAVPATETEKGLTEGLKCETCGKILKEQYPVDFEGNLYDPDDPDGPSIGTEIPKQPGDIYNPEDDLIGRLEGDVITDPNGEYIGTVDKDGNIVDENGDVIGKVDENGKVTDKDGNHVGDVFGFDELDGRLEPGHPNFSLKDYLDEYYTHVEGGDKIRPTIDEDKCSIGTKEKLEGDGITVLIKGAEDYAICPIDKYPMSQWIDLGNGMHKRVCTCLDCDYYEIAACVPFEITVDEVEYKICPICGHFTDEQAYEWIKGVKVGGVGDMNELIARDAEAPFGTDAALVKDMSDEPAVITSSFTAVKSTKGVLNLWFNTETLYIPMVHPGDVDLVMMNYAGEFTSVPYVYDNGFVIFNADEHGLYLFVK